jgi:NAD(P)-dependent dehydrogenase (short-subunit alcohol dehydrogenase family)
MRLEGKVVVVTGAASGMGRSMANLFAAEGAKVVAADSTKPWPRSKQPVAKRLACKATSPSRRTVSV